MSGPVPPPRIRLLASGGAVALVVLLWWLMRAGSLAGIDQAVLRAFSPSGMMLRLALAATWLGDMPRRLIVTALATVAMLVTRQPRRALAFAVITLGGAGLNSVAKGIVARPRPDLLPHLDTVSGYSFPSGHAANAAILYLALACLVPQKWQRVAAAAAGVLICAIGLSRVALAVHWPSDVVAGLLLGAAWMLVWHPLLAAHAVDRR